MCLLLLFAAGLQMSSFAQQRMLRHSLESVYFFLKNNYSSFNDTARLNACVDSIANENNIEKTEYASLFAFLEKSKTYASALAYFEKQAPVFAQAKTPAVKSLFKFYYGHECYSAKLYSLASDLMLEAASEFKAIGYDHIALIGEPFYILSSLYYNYNYRKSIEYGLLAEKFLVSDSTNGTYNTLGLDYQKLGLYDSAVMQFQKLMVLSQHNHSTVWYCIAAGNLGRTYCLKKDFARGISLLQIDVHTGRQYEPVNAALSALYIADAYLLQKRTDSAAGYIRLARNIVADAGLWNKEAFFINHFCYFYYQQQAALYRQLGNYRDAFNNLDSAIRNKEKYNAQFDWKYLSAAEKRIEGLEYQLTLKLLAAQKQNQQLQKVILIVVLFTVLVIALMVVYNQRMRASKQVQLAAEREANLLLKNQQAEQELENARQALDSLVLRFRERTELVKNAEANLEETTKESDSNAQQQATKILSSLVNASLLTQQDWLLFQQRFEKVYPGFFANLAQQVPGITPAEERILALLQLKVPYRQMALMLGISTQSVRTAKYRLRKKLVATCQSDLAEGL